MRTTPLNDHELEKAINAAATGFAYHLQTNAGMADLVCNQTLFWDDPMRAFSILDRYRSINKEDLTELYSSVIESSDPVVISVIPK